MRLRPSGKRGAGVGRGGLVALAAMLAVGSPTDTLWAQGDPQEEARLLRAAASRESRGDLAGAEAVLRDLVTRYPTSSGGVFALERVLRARGRVADILPGLVARLRELSPL